MDTVNVGGESIKERWGLLDLTDDRVATPAQQAADSSAAVVMVEDQKSGGYHAEEAPPALPDPHRLDLLRGQLVLAHETRAPVFGTGSFGISSAPATQAGVASWSVLHAVSPRSGIRAVPAVGPDVPTGSGEGVDRKILRAVGAAFGHAPIVPHQPCHADVLLELANR